MNPTPSPWRKSSRWIASGIAVLVMPKCVVCLTAYVGLVVGASAVGRELCGGVPAEAGWSFGVVEGCAYGLTMATVWALVGRHKGTKRKSLSVEG